jgi:hypothetical protein
VTDATSHSQTVIEVVYLSESADSDLWGLYYYNPLTPLWNSHWSGERMWCELSAEERRFSRANVAEFERDLMVPLRRGWSETLYFYGTEHVKSRLRWQPDGGGPVEFTVYAVNPGCLLAPFWSLWYSKLIAGARMRSETAVVGPMEGAA